MKKNTDKIIVLNKKEGETPLEVLESFRSKNKAYQDLKMTYAGRLDPMASGLLILLTGEETKNKEKYLSLDKEYEFEVLFGFATDTYDILGKVLKSVRQGLTQKTTRQDLVLKLELEKKIKQNLQHFTGKFMQKYPMYSSKTVAGKQLFEYARSGEDVVIPEREVNVKSLKLLKIKKINNKNLLENIEHRIGKVKGDFRQKEILKIWQHSMANDLKYAFKSNLSPRARGANFSARPPAKGFLKHTSSSFAIASFKIKCGSGTYVRSISNNLGEKIGIPALAFSIKRTKIGKWSKIT